MASGCGRPVGVAYAQGKGWTVYDLTLGTKPKHEPEFICVGTGKLPIPITASAEAILSEMFAIALIKASNLAGFDATQSHSSRLEILNRNTQGEP